MVKSLRAWRTERLLSTRRLAQLAGASNKTIVQIENGRQLPSFATIEKICRALEVEPQAITEFARAINQRAGTTVIELPAVIPAAERLHVVCISGSALFPALTRRLIDTERYGVTTIVAAPVGVDQIACLQPDLLILDVDTAPTPISEFALRLPDNPATATIPVIVTGRDPRRLDSIVANLPENGQPMTITPATGDLRDLLAAVDALACPNARS
jgi:transcriptional regulator with XRE-family HTH domain